MFTAIFAVLGIAGVMLGINLFDQNPRKAILVLIPSVFAILLALTFDPLGFLLRQSMDEREFDSQGNPNYWANMLSGEYIHKQDPRVIACNAADRMGSIDTNWGTFRTCSIFGTGEGQLYEAAGAVRQITDAIKAQNGRTNTYILKPGEILALDRSDFLNMHRLQSQCIQIGAILQNGGWVTGDSGIMYRTEDSGNTSQWFVADSQNETGRGAFYGVTRVHLRSPDKLPRVARLVFNVLRSPDQLIEAPPAFCF